MGSFTRVITALQKTDTLEVALACAQNDWPPDDWLRLSVRTAVSRVAPPYTELKRQPWHVVVLRCEDPGRDYPRLLDAIDSLAPPVLVISPVADAERIRTVLSLGATSYLVEGDYDPCVLDAAIAGTACGHTHLSPGASAVLRQAAITSSVGGGVGSRSADEVAGAVADGRGGRAGSVREVLSPREREIMDLLANGLGAPEIGRLLRLREKTVRNNLSNIYAKLKAQGRTDAVLLWLGAPRREQHPAAG